GWWSVVVVMVGCVWCFFFASRRRHTRLVSDWSSDVCSSDLLRYGGASMNGKGEVVVGVALMLMGENSRTVTERVKAKLVALQPRSEERRVGKEGRARWGGEN